MVMPLLAAVCSSSKLTGLAAADSSAIGVVCTCRLCLFWGTHALAHVVNLYVQDCWKYTNKLISSLGNCSIIVSMLNFFEGW